MKNNAGSLIRLPSLKDVNKWKKKKRILAEFKVFVTENFYVFVIRG